MNQEKNPKVTIAIPTYNRADLLSQTIKSVLNQSVKNIEIIISDNCSTDKTCEVVAAFHEKGVIYFRQTENLGMVGNWNFCLGQATGEFFLLLSDDDLLEEDAIASLLQALSDESVMLSYSPVSYIDSDSMPMPGISMRAPILESGDSFIAQALLGRRVVFPAAALYRTKQASRLGGYPDIGTATDLALHLMIAMQGRVACNPRPLVRYRMHSLSLSYTEQVIHSQVSLVDWVRSDLCPLRKLESKIVRHSVNFIFRWGKYSALEGNRKNADLALKTLQHMWPSLKWMAWFYCFNNPVVQRGAKIHSIAKQWAKRLIYDRPGL